MKHNIIVAVCNGNGIGHSNKLPWYYKEELRNFSKVTKGEGNNAIIMGKNTWDSLPKNHCLVELILYYQVLLIVLLT